MPSGESNLTVAVTGPTGTFGFGLMPLLQADDRIARVMGIARRPFDPAAYGWTKMDYRRGDVRDPQALRDVFGHADVVVHLAFLVTGAASTEAIRSINVDGTLNAFGAAAAAGVRRFVYSSSVAAYGFHRDNPVGMTEDWPVRPAARLFYAKEKAELENLLRAEAGRSARPVLYLLRPSIVVGPHAVGAKDPLPGPLTWLARAVAGRAGRLPVPVPILVPSLPVQLVHEQDLGQALLRCIVAAGPPGAYNIADDGIITAADIAREFGLLPLPIPADPIQSAARAISALPFLPPVAQWVEAASHPAIMDTTRAKQELGWVPRFTALEALQDTLRRDRGQTRRLVNHTAAHENVGTPPALPPPRRSGAEVSRMHLPQAVSGIRSMTTAFPGPATNMLTTGVIHPHPVNGGRWYLLARRPPRSRSKPGLERSGTTA